MTPVVARRPIPLDRYYRSEAFAATDGSFERQSMSDCRLVHLA
jgi:hypothetical protein